MAQTVEINTKQPTIYARRVLPAQFIERMEALGAKVIVDPWEWKAEEPKPTQDISDCQIILTVGIRDQLNILKDAPNVKWVHSFSAGVEGIQNSPYDFSNITITNSRGVTSVPISEHTMAMILAFARGVPTMMTNKSERKWEMIPVMDVSSSTVAIIGYGEIGSQIAKRSKALGMKVLGCKRNPDQKALGQDYADEIVGMDKLDEVLAEADFVVLSLPSTEETRYMFNKELLSKIKKGSYLINVGRGNTIVEADLVDLLQSKHIAGAALDVFEVEPLPNNHAFWEMDEVIVSPHNSYLSPNHMDGNFELFLDNLKRYIDGEPLKNVVDIARGY